MKYLIYHEPDTGEHHARLFLAPTTHQQVALEVQAQHPGRIIVSAGFVEVLAMSRRYGLPERVQVRTFGRSDSLDLNPRLEDAAFLAGFIKATLSSARNLFDPARGHLVSLDETAPDLDPQPTLAHAIESRAPALAGSPAFPRHD